MRSILDENNFSIIFNCYAARTLSAIHTFNEEMKKMFVRSDRNYYGVEVGKDVKMFVYKWCL